ncbi:hypothetical protein ACFQZS_18010 [Mucilaginibacter calamicampi]|uniref:Rad50/SbcC-type AAA domain-containing protein n=1 Tax=Mucilaginibacter calamicampi TaxID=1302352 RepID=A0ABW2Z1T6_9SPHI
MSRLIINKLIYQIVTIDNSKYGAEVPFKDGLNIIFGPNSVGKTSIITGIIYGLGAEKGLGIFKSIQNPFKPEFYQKIDNRDVKRSYLLLEISNGTDIITIFRYIVGGDNTLAAIKRCAASDFFTNDHTEKLIVVGDGVFSENGFQRYLFQFLGLHQVELPTYDQKLSKLYLENILPLFFVEQRAGWSQIQARQVVRYNIKEVKKVAFEYLLGLDRFKIHISEIKLKELENELRQKKDELLQKEENLFVIANGEGLDEVLLIRTEPIGKVSIHDYITYLKDRYIAETALIDGSIGIKTDEENRSSSIRERLKILNYRLRSANGKVDKVTLELAEYQSYLQRIQSNKYKNKQLKKIQEFSTDLNIKICPVCESKLLPHDENECFLCHNDLTKKLSTPEQNLEFLEDEENTFKKVIERRLLDRRRVFEEQNNIKDEIIQLEAELDHQITTYAGSDFAILRQRILSADNLNKELEKYERILKRWTDLSPLRESIKTNQALVDQLKEEVNKYAQTENDRIIIDTIRGFIRSNVKKLGLFKGKADLINSIKLDASDNYTPYLDNFDIYNISSSSDNIRIILSYYLALLQTSLKLKSNGRIIFPDILILDEPKQQNLDNDSLIDSVKLMVEMSNNSSQIILTTYSELPEDRQKLEKHIIYEMKSKTDFLLKKQLAN